MEMILNEYVLALFGPMLLLAGVTLVAELPVFLVGFGRERFSFRYKLAVFILINLISFTTVLTIWLTIAYLSNDAPFGIGVKILLSVLQIIVALVEAFVYKKAFKTETAKTLIFSFIANVLSAAADMFVIYMFGM